MNQDIDAETFPVLNVTSNASSISVHDWYGEVGSTNVWGFNPTPLATIDFSGSSSSSFNFSMDEYSLDDQDHPILFLVEVNGAKEVVTATTDCCFLANNPDEIKKTFATYASLSTSGLTSGNYVLVTEDENYDSSNKPTTLKKYNGSSFANVTYATKAALQAALEADTSHTTFVSGACFGVVSDEDHYNSTTAYKYNSSNDSFEMIYIKLEENHNPLSSAVKFNTLEFASDPKTNGTSYHDFGSGSTEYMPINKSSLSDDVSFVTVNNNGTSSFSNELIIFDQDTGNSQYVGIIVNYNPASLEYICSYYIGHHLLEDSLGFSCDWSLGI